MGRVTAMPPPSQLPARPNIEDPAYFQRFFSNPPPSTSSSQLPSSGYSSAHAHHGQEQKKWSGYARDKPNLEGLMEQVPIIAIGYYENGKGTKGAEAIPVRLFLLITDK